MGGWRLGGGVTVTVWAVAGALACEGSTSQGTPTGDAGTSGTGTGTATAAGTGTGTGGGLECPWPQDIDYGDCTNVDHIGTEWCFIDSLTCDASTIMAQWHDHDACGEGYLMTCTYECPEACTESAVSQLPPPIPTEDVIAAMCQPAAGGSGGAGGGVGGQSSGTAGAGG